MLKKIAVFSLCFLAGCAAKNRAKHFNREAAAPGSKAREILRTLELKPGMKIADIGAGGGYFTYLFAEAVGREGTVWALDVNPDFVKFIQSELDSRGITNVKALKVAPDSAGLSPKSVDLIFMRNVFHHLDAPEVYFKDLRPAIVPGGRLVIIEHSAGGAMAPHGHATPVEKIIEIMKRAGYSLTARHDILEHQSFTVYAPVP